MLRTHTHRRLFTSMAAQSSLENRVKRIEFWECVCEIDGKIKVQKSIRSSMVLAAVFTFYLCSNASKSFWFVLLFSVWFSHAFKTLILVQFCCCNCWNQSRYFSLVLLSFRYSSRTLSLHSFTLFSFNYSCHTKLHRNFSNVISFSTIRWHNFVHRRHNNNSNEKKSSNRFFLSLFLFDFNSIVPILFVFHA